jgi:putative ABC transport system ATP-binding protein
VAASYADAVLFLADGRLAGRMSNPTAQAIAENLARLGDQVARQRDAGATTEAYAAGQVS